MTVQQLSPHALADFAALIHVFAVAFEWEKAEFPPEKHLQKVLNNEKFIVFVAKIDGQVVGGLTGHLLDRYDAEKPSLYLYDIAVLPEHQRNGIGKRLIGAMQAYCAANGISEAFVQAETEDEQAVTFYRKTAASSELHAIHFTYSFD